MKNALSYKLIEQAASGDETAIDRIVEIYQPYINTLASRTLYDSEGNEYIGVNVDLRDHLTRKLVAILQKYQIA